MANILDHEMAAILARDAQYLRPVPTISGDARESQDFFEREMMTTCRDDDFSQCWGRLITTHLADAVSPTAGIDDARRTYDRFDVSAQLFRASLK